MKTTTADLQLNHIKYRFECVGATYTRIQDVVIVAKDKDTRSFSLHVHMIEDFESLLKEWGEK